MTGGLHGSCELIKISIMSSSNGTPAVCPLSRKDRARAKS